MSKVEILAPAGDEASAQAAIDSGADAIYLGMSRFSARDSAENFDSDGLKRLLRRAHLLGVKGYVCLNTLVKDSELEAFTESAAEAYNAGADAILVQDLFLGKKLKELYPEIELHLSTQAGCCNLDGALLAKEFGFSRVVLARETPLSEIGRIARIIETECFVQGALCSSFSGQCYFSSFAGNNSGNRGRCKQPCRKLYSIDRRGYETPAYALSLSDLSVGERVFDLISAGVTSLKIEGRLRRPEYVAAAVEYYRALLSGEEGKEELSRLKRAFNRGDYTRGLAFGQDDRLLSRRVQGHIGERVGSVHIIGGKYFVRGSAGEGDSFKILREGGEVGGAAYSSSGEGGFYLSSAHRLAEGDEVRMTTDRRKELSAARLRPLTLSLRFVAGERARVTCGEFVFEGETLPSAKNAPLTREELIRCFDRTDGLPFAVGYERIETDNAFLPKSSLNALRREFYERLTRFLLPVREELRPAPIEGEVSTCSERRTAVLSPDFRGLKADILILKPQDYAEAARLAKEGTGEKYLYLPPFLTAEDEELVKEALPAFDGIYCDGLYGIKFAERVQKPLFAGTGFNLTNRIAVSEAQRRAKYLVLSKELTLSEQRALAGEGTFALSLGAVKTMDLIYCPFGRTCTDCDRRELYRLRDEEGREFPLRRYRLAGACRFEVYNCASLSAYNGETGALCDLSAGEPKAIAEYAMRPEKGETYLKNVTRGHANRSLL